MSSTTDPRAAAGRAADRTRRHGPKAVVWGLATRGVLYLLLAWMAVQLVAGHAGGQVDSRGALHQLAGSAAGSVVLVVLAFGFAALALWNAVDAATAGSGADDAAGRRVADVGRVLVYAALTVAAISVLVSGRGSDADRTSKTWTAAVLGWPGGRLLVGAVGVAIVVGGAVLVARVVRGDPPEARSIVEAAPRETSAVHTLGVIGNAARGAVVALLGLFVLVAAIDHDPNESVGLDGALKRLLDESFGGAVVLVVALGFAAYGVYSLARAWTNRAVAAR